jgi:guanyl-specific ribonuclease Sa
MIKRISLLLLLAALAGCGSSDSQILAAWIKAFEQGDIEAVQRLTSSPSINWERSANSMAKRTILDRTIVSASDVPPGAQRIRWKVADPGPSEYLCSDVSVVNGKIKVWQKPVYCTGAGIYELPK